MKIIFFVMSLFLLTSCTYLTSIADIHEKTFDTPEQLITCQVFPFDDSDQPCNLVGWQTFAYQALNASESEHKMALLLLTDASQDVYKRLILESSVYEPDNIRQQAMKAMFKISDNNINRFGQFFYLLASHNQNNLLNNQRAIRAEAKLKIQNRKNTQLKKQLSDAQAKIQAIMDIEQDLNTN